MFMICPLCLTHESGGGGRGGGQSHGGSVRLADRLGGGLLWFDPFRLLHLLLAGVKEPEEQRQPVNRTYK